MTEIPTHTMEEFVAFCKKKGNTKFNRLIPSTCAFAKFFRSIYPDTQRALIFGLGDGVRAFDNQFNVIAILNIDEDDKKIIFHKKLTTFEEVAKELLE